MGQADGYQKVKSGEIAATVLIAGKPTGSFGKFKLEPGMTLLPVPYTEALEQDYLPSRLTHEDYPNLIPKGSSVDTVAIPSVLAVYNWPRDTDRYRRVALFIDAFFSKFREFQKPPRHGKWKEANLAATLRGWRRFPAAEEWLARNADKPTADRAAGHRSGHRARPGGQGRAQQSGRAGAPVTGSSWNGPRRSNARRRVTADLQGAVGVSGAATWGGGERREVGRRQRRAIGDRCAAPCVRLLRRAGCARCAMLGTVPGRAQAQSSPRPSITVAATIAAEPASQAPLAIARRPACSASPATASCACAACRRWPRLSDGHSIAPGAWAIALDALPNLKIALPAGCDRPLRDRHHAGRRRRQRAGRGADRARGSGSAPAREGPRPSAMPPPPASASILRAGAPLQPPPEAAERSASAPAPQPRQSPSLRKRTSARRGS